MKRPILFLVLYIFALPALASEAKLEYIHPEASVTAVERGAEAFMNSCHGCHSLKYVRFRDLSVFGVELKKIDEWRGDQSMDAQLSSLMPEDAAMLSFGTKPPDLSLMTKARDGGPSYVYSYLIGYYLTKEGTTGNHIFPETKMPDALGFAGTEDPVQLAEAKKNAFDIVSFLSWAADPHESERHRLGYYVIGYLIILTILFYLVKNQIWSRLK